MSWRNAAAFVLGAALGGAATYLLTPRSSLDQFEAMARAQRLAEERADKCEAGR